MLLLFFYWPEVRHKKEGQKIKVGTVYRRNKDTKGNAIIVGRIRIFLLCQNMVGKVLLFQQC